MKNQHLKIAFRRPACCKKLHRWNAQRITWNKFSTFDVIPKKNCLPAIMSVVLFFVSLAGTAQLTANFTANLTNGCAPILVNFTDQSVGNPTQWKWDLGNGTFSNLQNPSVTYFNPGQYPVKLLVKTSSNKDSVIKTNYITVYSSPLANFTSNAVTGCSPFTVNFSDASNANGGNINNWQWDFGDGTLAAQQHPSHTYVLSGTYNVTLKITNANGCAATMRKPGFIRNNVIKASFFNRTFSTCTPQKIVFQNTSTSNGIINAKWDFGDSTYSTLANPIHSYARGGNYIVKLIVQSANGCTDSILKNLVVVNNVSAFFTADNTGNCKPPAMVHFTNQTLASNNYYWDFGDSGVASISNPAHYFSDPGKYTVKLVVRNGNGCVDSFQRTDYITVHSPLFSFKNLPDSGCQAFTKKMLLNTDTANPITGYLWSFGDGTTSTDSVPVHTFTNLGFYTVSLAASGTNGCRDTIELPYAINVSTKPIANFSADNLNSCAKTGVTFTNLSSANTLYWHWDFGDYTSSEEKAPFHSYKDTGWMTIGLIAMNGGCTDTAVFENYVNVKPALAKFNIAMDCAAPFQRSFINLSIGADRCLWNFGDGTTSTEREPVHIFPSQGEYMVTLNVWNDSTGCDYSLTKQVLILKIIPSFSASDTVICKGNSTTFSSVLSNPDVTRFFWEFGDGTTALNRNNTQTHTYTLPGTYTVKLVTMSLLNCFDTIIKPMYIKVNGPRAKFGVAPAVCANSATVFLDSSLVSADNPVVKWIWKYGDGIIDTLATAPFQHIYTAMGSYPVSLKLVDTKGCTDTFRLPQLLKVNKVNARFYTLDSIACPNQPVKFICPFTSQGATYRWDFGDGTTSGLQFPSHSYTTEGIYTVKLYIKDIIGCEDSSAMTNIVRVIKTKAFFTMSDSFRVCPPLLVQFTNQSANAVGEYWDFGDSTSTNTLNPSHFYTYPGIYTVVLYAKGPGGCVDTMQRKIEVKGPKGSITFTPLKFCTPFSVNFQVRSVDAVSYIWDFNDGNTVPGFNTNITHTYQDSGSFVPKVILVDEIGCRVPVNGRDTISSLFAKAMFSFSDTVVCNQSDVSFMNQSITNDSITAYHWDFGDGAISAFKNPVHQYGQAGLYYPSLTATTSFGCSNLYRSAVPIRVVHSPNINITSTGNGCAPLTTTWGAQVTGTNASSIHWHWDFGGDNTFSLQNPPPQLYGDPGSYTATLTATSNIGCTKTIHATVQAYALPSLQTSADTLLCRGKAVALAANGANRYKWSPSTGLNCDTCALVVASPSASVQYAVTGTTQQGCSSSKTISLNVKQPVKITYSSSDKLCAGQSKRLQAGGATTYQWTPANGLSNAAIASPLAQPQSTTTYRVVGSDDAGCFKDTGYVKLNVFPIPVVNAGEDKTINVGRPVDLEATYSADVTELRWSPTDGLFRNNTNVITVKPKENTEYTVEVTNGGGCTARDKVQVFVLCNGTNVFVPNLFSPNNDGVNDVFYPRGSGLFKIKNLRIFNRWGEAVFEKGNFNSNDASAGWDGTFKGTKLGTDVYIYMLELICDNNSVLAFNGNISLVR